MTYHCLKNNRLLKILFVQPRLQTQTSKPTRMPVGLMSLASALRDKIFVQEFCKKLQKNNLSFDECQYLPEFRIKIIDLQAEKKCFDFCGYLKKNKPDIIGFTATTPTIDNVFEMCLLAEQTLPCALRIIGGPHASALPESTLKLSNLQILVKGEGVETLLELLLEIREKTPSLSRISGIYYKNDLGDIIANKARRKIFKLNEYPFPAASVDLLNINNYEELIDVENKKQGQAGTLFTSTGCPYGKCVFCASKNIFPSKIDMRSAQSIFKEIDFFYHKGFRAFYIIDDLFTINRSRLLQLSELMQQSNIKIQYSMMTRANYIDIEISNVLKRTGCKVAALGVESGDQDLLDNVIDKGLSLREIEAATELLKLNKIHVKYFFMVGLPNQDFLSIRKTILFILRNNPDSINVSIAIPYPGSDLYNDQRIKVFYPEISGYSLWQHEVEPQRKHHDQTKVITETNVMKSSDIDFSRNLILEIFARKHEKGILEYAMKKLDKFIEEKY